MPGPKAIARTHVKAAGVDSDQAFDIERVRQVIRTVDSLELVGKAQQGGYDVDVASLRALLPHYEPMIVAAVARANCDPLGGADGQVRAAGAEDNLPDRIKKAGEGLAGFAQVQDHVRRLLVGARAEGHWWGLRVLLTGDAAAALVDLLEKDATKVLGFFAVTFHGAAAVLAVVMASGGALGEWVRVVNSDKGVEMDLYMWAVPWVERRV